MKKFTNILYFCFLSFILSGCYYKDGCWYAPQSAYCPMKNYKSDLQRYYKSDGQPVSEEQKINNIKACGGIIDGHGNISNGIKNGSYINNFDAIKKFNNCMENKGYKYDSVAT